MFERIPSSDSCSMPPDGADDHDGVSHREALCKLHACRERSCGIAGNTSVPRKRASQKKTSGKKQTGNLASGFDVSA
jgi:hypothetical protein